MLNRISRANIFSSESDTHVITDVARPPSVTKILQATQSAKSIQNLQRWEAAKIKEMGEAKFKEYSAGNKIKYIIIFCKLMVILYKVLF